MCSIRVEGNSRYSSWNTNYVTTKIGKEGIQTFAIKMELMTLIDSSFICTVSHVRIRISLF